MEAMVCTLDLLEEQKPEHHPHRTDADDASRSRETNLFRWWGGAAAAALFTFFAALVGLAGFVSFLTRGLD